MNTIRIAASGKERSDLLAIIRDYPLSESLEIVETSDTIRNSGLQPFLLLADGNIHSHPEWFNQTFPLVFPEVPLSGANLLGILFYHLGLLDDAQQISTGGDVSGIISGLLGGQPVREWMDPFISDPVYAHNIATIEYYSKQNRDTKLLKQNFEMAVNTSELSEIVLFSFRHYASLCIEIEDPSLLDRLRLLCEADNYHPAIQLALRLELVRTELLQNQIKQTSPPRELLETVAALKIQYKNVGADFTVAEILDEMSSIAFEEHHYTESLSYLKEAIEIYRREGQHIMEAELLVKKATVFHQWAKAGSPHFYQQAVQAFQEVMKIIKRDEHPYWFAEIQNRLGVLYAEMPEAQQKRSIWAAVSASSFKEALNFFDKSSFPYEYATVCHNYATALINYPDAVKSDNIEKALHYFNESLAVRSADYLPRERTMTLLNYLEASWEASNVNGEMERVRLSDMRMKSKEILSLTDDPAIIQRANEHLLSIDKLSETLTNA